MTALNAQIRVDSEVVLTLLKNSFSAPKCCKLVFVLSASWILLGCEHPIKVIPDYPLQNDVCDFFNQSTDMIEFWLGLIDSHEVGDVKFKIPAEYFDPFDRKIARAKANHGTAFIRYRVSDFAPYTQERTRIGIKKDPTPYARLGLRFVGNLTRNFGIKTGLEPHEVQEFLAEQPQVEPDEIYPKLIGRFGGDDIYFDYTNAHVTDLIVCSKQRKPFPRSTKPPRKVNLTCIDYFIADRFGFTLFYDKDYLPVRKELKRDALKFIDCAFVKI